MGKLQITSLTGLRGIAAWFVVVYHFRDVFLVDFPYVERLFANGFYAVDLFFVLSGFVIYLSTQDYFNKAPWRLAVRRFYNDRFARIYPLHIFILICFILNPVALYFFSSSGSMDQRYSISYFIASVFLVQNWGLFNELKWNIPAWSISSEVVAYLVYPVAYIVGSRLRTIGSCFFTLVLIQISFAVFHLIFGLDSLAADISKFGTVRCIFEFLMGVMIAKLYLLEAFRFSKSFATFALLSIFPMLWFLDELGVANFLFFPPLICTLVILLVGSNGPFSNVLGSRLLCHFGVISYSVYLSHYFVKDWVKFLSDDIGYTQFVIYMLTTYLVSLFLYHFVELPAKLYLRRNHFGRVE